jgi:hypothetical protein
MTVLTTGIKITEKKNYSGEFFEVDSLLYSELFLYVGELVFYENRFYMVSVFEYETTEAGQKAKKVYRGKKLISQE